MGGRERDGEEEDSDTYFYLDGWRMIDCTLRQLRFLTLEEKCDSFILASAP